LHRICNILNLLYEINRKYRKVSYKEFYNDKINKDKAFKKREIRKWYNNKINGLFNFTIFDYAWMLNPESKFLMLSIENDIQQDEEAKTSHNEENIINYLILGSHDILPYCTIEIRRPNLIEDSLNILSKPNINFKKELKVKFIGEQGVDAGGIRKEFFQLVVKHIFDPAYAMFHYNEETRTFWFNPDTFEPNIKFELIGFILGLALYNSVMLDVHFPRVLYKKLLGLEVSMEVLCVLIFIL